MVAEHVRVLRDGETVSVDGTHLGHSSVVKVPSPPLPLPPFRGGWLSCASSGRTGQLWPARRFQYVAGPKGAPPLPRVLERAASKGADFTAFDLA